MRAQFWTALLLPTLLFGCKSKDSEPTGVWGVPNVDDDDGDGQPDWETPDAGDDEILQFEVPRVKGRAKTYRLTLKESARSDVQGSSIGGIRVWTSGQQILTEESTTIDLPLEKGVEPVLGFEFEGYNQSAAVEIIELNGGGKAIGEPRLLEIGSSPFLLNTHLQPALEVQSVEIQGENDAMVNAYEDALGDRYRIVDGPTYFFDVWLQDEIEYTTMHGEGVSTGVVIDSVRDRGLDDVVENMLVGPEIGRIERGIPQIATSQDSFGNLEVTPPLTVGGVRYPFGRVYSGDWFGDTVAPELMDFIRDNGAQDPFTLDVSWLYVGHVDEYVTFIPDSTSPKGFRVAIANIPRAYELLEQMDPATSLPQYAGFQTGHGISTVGQMLNDAALRATNEEIESVHIAAAKATLINELDLTESDFIYIPSLFEEVPGGFGAHASLIPGMVNLIVANPPGEQSRIFLADPFMRTDVGSQADDPFIEEVGRIMPEQHELVFVDNWFTYHLALGEVHCGTNVIRAPHTTPWWPTQDEE